MHVQTSYRFHRRLQIYAYYKQATEGDAQGRTEQSDVDLACPGEDMLKTLEMLAYRKMACIQTPPGKHGEMIRRYEQFAVLFPNK